MIKGESSHWINKHSICGKEEFEWQNDYFAVSVSAAIIDKVRQYIARQEEHHKTKTFAEEYDEFMKQFKT